MRHHHVLIGVIALSLFASAPAFAQDAAQDEVARAEMLELSDKASKAFQKGDYEGAAKLFAQANEKFGDNLLIMNEMIAWYKAGDCDNATRASGAFLGASENDLENDQNQADRMSAHRVVFKCHIKASEAALADGDRDEAIRFATMAELVYDEHKDIENGFKPDDKVELETLSTAIEASGKTKTPPDDKTDPIEEPEGSGGLTAIGWAGVGGLAGGAILLGYGGLLYSQNAEPINDFNTTCQTPNDEPLCLRGDELEQAIQTQQIVLIAGGALAAVGAGLLVYDLVSGGESDATQAKVVPVVGADGGGVQVLFSF